MKLFPGVIGTLQFDLPVYTFILAAILSGGLAYFMYRNLEGVAGFRRTFLSVLRGVSLFLLFLVAANLVVSIVRHNSEKHQMFVLLDDSRSMSLKDGGISRSGVVRQILGSSSYDSLKDILDPVLIPFGGSVLKNANPDSMKFDQPSTDIQAPLAEVERLSNSGRGGLALLITDGNYNSGGNPADAARDLSVPVFTIGIGYSTQPKDVLVKQLIPAPSVYAGKSTVVNAVISSFGYGGAIASAQLMVDGREVDSKVITLPGSGDVEVSFSFTPQEIGSHTITVNVPAQKGEFNRENNRLSATVDVRKGKFSVLLVAGEPSADVAFVRRALSDNRDFHLSVLIQKDGSGFFEKNPGEILSGKYDAIILCDFPNAQSSGTAAQIFELMRSTDIPYAYIAGERFSQAEIRQVPRFPCAISEYQDVELQAGIAPSDPGSLPLNLQPLNALIVSNSGLFPPLYYRRIECRPGAGAFSLAVPVVNGQRIPATVFCVNPSLRSAAFLAYGIWRLKLMSSLSGLPPDFLDDFLASLVRTLVTGGKQKLLTLHTDKRVYDPSESVNFNALVVDQSGSPITDAAVDVTVRNDATRRIAGEVRLTPSGGGSYAGEIGGLPEGKYTFIGDAMSVSDHGGRIGADSGAITVEPLNAEFIRTPMNPQVLRSVASVSGGEFLTPSEFIRKGIPLNTGWKQPVTVVDTKSFELLSSLPFLAIAVILLTAEWVMRKLWGLP